MKTTATDEKTGIIFIGRLNPVALLEETGVKIQPRAMAGMVKYEKLFHDIELGDRFGSML